MSIFTGAGGATASTLTSISTSTGTSTTSGPRGAFFTGGRVAGAGRVVVARSERAACFAAGAFFWGCGIWMRSFLWMWQ